MLKDNIKDITAAIKYITTENKLEELRNLEKTSNIFTVCFIAYLWISIFFLWYLVAYKGLYFFPLAVIVVAIQQRTLRNILHDASHNSLLRNPIINDLIADFFAGYPLFEKTKYFRKSHLDHHRFLGIKEKDPDFVCINTLDPTNEKSSFSIYLKAIFMQRWLLSSNLGNLIIFTLKEYLELILWWSCFTFFMLIFFTVNKFIIFLCIWFIAKISIYHCLKVFMEISDHAGLPINGIIMGTRNLPSKFSSYIFFPFGDNYHLTHHLFPKIQTFKLKKMHNILMHWDKYANACSPNNYLSGHNSVIKNWLQFRTQSPKNN